MIPNVGAGFEPAPNEYENPVPLFPLSSPLMVEDPVFIGREESEDEGEWGIE
jgi:hypothetical protein